MDIVERKKHAIELNSIRKRLDKLGIYNYVKEFPSIDADTLYRVMNSRKMCFATLEKMKERLTEIENKVAELEGVKK